MAKMRSRRGDKLRKRRQISIRKEEKTRTSRWEEAEDEEV
jgi:hypothetical protein